MIDLSKFDNRDFDRGASRLTEMLWRVFSYFFFLTEIPVPSRLKCWLLRRFGAVIGKGVVIRAQVKIHFPWKLEIGDNVWIGEEVFILNLAKVTVENNVCISQRAFVCAGSHDFHKPSFDLIVSPIVIGCSSWIAAGAFVARGQRSRRGHWSKRMKWSRRRRSDFNDNAREIWRRGSLRPTPPNLTIEKRRKSVKLSVRLGRNRL